MPPHLKKLKNQVHSENGTYEQTVTHLEMELQLNGLEGPDELQINTLSLKTADTNADRPKPTCHHCTKPGHYRNMCCLLKKQKEQSKGTQNNPLNKNNGVNNSVPNNNTNKNNNNKYKNSNKAERKPKSVYPSCQTCRNTNHSTEKGYYGANAANIPPPPNARKSRKTE